MRAESTSCPPYQVVVPSPLPHTPYLGLCIEDGWLAGIDYLGPESTPTVGSEHHAVCAWLRSYFTAQPELLEVPFRPVGTPFQLQVWQRLAQMSFGEVVTYGALARELNSSPRAVAGACRANPIPIVIPCHRVIAAHGMGGYLGKTAGQALDIKQWLLQHEGYVCKR